MLIFSGYGNSNSCSTGNKKLGEAILKITGEVLEYDRVAFSMRSWL
jgi:hypothetical protein